MRKTSHYTEGSQEKVGIEPGNAVPFELQKDGRVVLLKVGGRSAESRFAALRGRAGEGMSTDEVMALTRGDGAG